ncbi:MAG: GAF domain-containing protein [Alphaproteobacteria bacterium]|nr:GAF domain-containing protein [Alphaproteobacteria bacterium]
MLLQVSKTVAGIETLDEVLATLVTIGMRETGAERGTLFLNDDTTNELYSRVTQGEYTREIRLLNNTGVAGHVFTSGQGEIIHDAYADDRFNHTIDKQTGYTTKNILCVPIRTVKGEVIGVAQLLNKIDGEFEPEHQSLLEAITTQAAVALQSAQFAESMKKSRLQELAFLDMVADITSEIDLGQLLKKVMGEATTMLNAERSTLFLNDEKTNELWSQVGEGLETTQIRFPNHLGIAGAVFTSGESVNIRHAYADLRFNPAFDKQTGYFTRSILCVPVINKDGKSIGVTQILNKKGGPFNDEDESRLKAFTAQVSIGLENAKLFDDVQNMKNYNESMLQSMSNGVITMDDNRKIMTCNAAGLKTFQVEEDDIIGKQAEEFFQGENEWLIDQIDKVEETQEQENLMDAELAIGEEPVSINLTALPLISSENKKLGTMFMIEDISSEKRVKSTMARYMDPGLADQLLGSGEEILGGKNTNATILFSDIRGFTPLTEELGAQGTVSLLNEYFTIMVDCIQQEEGMLDKFIGDAIMAAFGIPIAHDDDADRAMRTSIKMITSLTEFNRDRIERKLLPVNIGIGLNTDSVVSGNIGSPKRMDYTVIGDGVNLAARLESACKQYNAQILISENTLNQLKGTYRTRDIDDVVVKGKTKPVRIYEVLDYHTDESFPNLMDTVNYFNEGRKLYHEASFKKAIEAFKEALNANPGDGLSGIYIDRCDHLIAEPPKQWDGVWVMTSK